MKKKLIAAVAIAIIAALGAVGLSACNKKGFDPSKNISVVAREDGSGTKSAFMEIVGLKDKKDVSGVIIAGSTASVLAEVKGNPQAIAYESLGYVTDDVKMLKVEGVKPTIENIKNGTYGIARPLSIVYKASTVESGITKAFFDFLASAEAQDLISANGYVSTKDNAVAYTVQTGLSGTINVSGSTSLQPLMIKLAAKFESLQGGVSVSVSGGGSGTGYKNAESDVSHFGMISEEFTLSKASSCTSYEVAKDGIAVIVNKSNTFDDISLADLKNIYNCEQEAASKIKTWDQVGK